MSVLSLYLNRIFFVRLSVALSGIAMFALLFDLLDASEDLAGEASPAKALAIYAILRLPTLLTEILPIAALLGALFTASELLRSSELVVMWASGLSALRIMLMLVPAGLLIFVLKLANDDLAVPYSIEQLRAWGVGNYRKAALGADEGFLWVQEGDDIIRVPLMMHKDEKLLDILIFRLDEEGKLTERIRADHAEIEEDGWLLVGVSTHRLGGKKIGEQATLFWPNTIPMNKVRTLSRPPQEIGLAELVEIVRNDGFGIVHTERHRTWLYYRIAGAFVPMLMSFLGLALAYRFSRGGGIGGLFMRGVAIGFSFLIVSGLCVALGEAGFLPPLIAAIGPTALLALGIFSGVTLLSRRVGPGT